MTPPTPDGNAERRRCLGVSGLYLHAKAAHPVYKSQRLRGAGSVAPGPAATTAGGGGGTPSSIVPWGPPVAQGVTRGLSSAVAGNGGWLVASR